MSSLKSKSYLLQVLSPPCKSIQDSKITLTDETIGCTQVGAIIPMYFNCVQLNSPSFQDNTVTVTMANTSAMTAITIRAILHGRKTGFGDVQTVEMREKTR